MIDDIKFALRSLARTPGFAAVSILILALSIGAVTGVFSAIEAVLLRPLPFAQPEQLYCLHSAEVNEIGLFSLPEYCAYRDQVRSFQGLAGAGTFSTNLVDQGEAQFVRGTRITANAFDLLGVRPVAGRLLVPDDDRPGAPHVVVISEGLWRRTFGGTADVVGKVVTLKGSRCVIVGVAPSGFVLPIVGYSTDIFVPLQGEADPQRYQMGSGHFLRVFGRLATGATPAQSLADMDVAIRDLRTRYPKDFNGSGGNTMMPLTEQIVGNARPMLMVLFGLVIALLMLASTNLAGLQLVRAIGRSHDFALRTALGASRTRLIRLVVAEGLLLAVAGGLIGLLLADWGVTSLSTFMPADLPRGHDLRLDGAIFGFAALVSITFGLAPALAPIWMVSRTDLRGAMAAGGRRMAGGQNRIRNVLASIQVALALALLACTALFLRSFWAVSSESLGFDSANTLTARLSLPEATYNDRDSQIRRFDILQSRLKALPGVENVGADGILPLVPGIATIDFKVTGQVFAHDTDEPSANYRLITPGFFEAMGIPMRTGRSFTNHDDMTHPLVAVVSAALAKNLFPNQDPIGKRLDLGDSPNGDRTVQIIGVVGNVKQGRLEDDATYDIYVSFRQMDESAVPWNCYRTYWVLRGTFPAASMEAVLRKEVQSEDNGMAISSVQTLSQVTSAALSGRKFTLMMIGFFAVTALILTTAGIYSVIAFGVAQRTREIGVRLALGAKAEQIFGIVIAEGLMIVAIGAPLGILGSLVLSRLVATQLFGVSPHDPVTLIAASLMIAIIAVVASWLPARRAARVDPIVALRAD